MSRAFSFAHPRYLQYVKGVENSRGNSPGFPNEFQYLNFQKLPDPTSLTQNPEYVIPHVNQDVYLEQIWRPGPITGQYEAMVPDTPFNPIYEANKNGLRALMGFTMMGIGSLFFI